jgi:hypothetical protein
MVALLEEQALEKGPGILKNLRIGAHAASGIDNAEGRQRS